MQKTITYNLIRSKRKSIAIHITKDATVEVRAPFGISKAEIDRIVTSKQNWIHKRLVERQEQIEQKAEFLLNYKSLLSVQGKVYPITVKDDNELGFDGKSFYLPPNLSSKEIKYAAIQIYKMIAKNVLTNKVSSYSKLMKVAPRAVKINSAKTRWGSCSSKNSINFSWRLIMADEDVIDYVVVHELAHIKEHNHSARFWTVVESVLPDYKERIAKLKAFEKHLAGEDWE